MTKKISAALLIVIVSTSLSNAQSVNVGAKLGINAQKIDNKSFEEGFNWGWLAGGFVHLNLSKTFGVGGDIILNQTSYKPASGFNGIISNIKKDSLKSIKLNYLSIPVYVNIGEKFKIQLGAQYSIKINEAKTLANNVRDAFNGSDFQALAGFHLNLPMSFFVSGRYLVGLSNVKEIANQDNWKSQSIQISAGLKF
jgi:hypothetical protein